MTDERLREIAKKHARNAIAPIGSREHANRTDPVVMQGMVRAEEVIFYALKEAFALPEALRSEWIPVGERLPELGVKVLTVSPFGVENPERYSQFFETNYRMQYPEGIGWCGYGGDRDNYIPVSHWMPLPSIPSPLARSQEKT